MISLWQISVYGGVLVLVTLGVRALCLHRLPKGVLVALWGLCVLRLLLPFSLPSGWSVYGALDAAIEQAAEATGAEQAAPVQAVRGFIRPAGTAGIGAGLEVAGPSPAAPSPWLMVWALGACLLGLFFLGVYLRSRRRFLGAVPEDDPALLSLVAGAGLGRRVRLARADLPSPLTYGILRPVILLPLGQGAAAAGLPYVLTHELVHIRRLDGLKKGLLLLALCVHWFNPLVWLLYAFANRDIELACDEAVLTRWGRENRAGYARTLIGYAEVRGPAVFSAFGQHSIEERIKTVMKYQKKNRIATLAGLVLVLGVALAFATGAGAALTESMGGPLISEEAWAQDLQFAQAVIEAANIPEEDLRTLQSLLEASNQVSAGELRGRFAAAAEASDTLFASANELILAEYDAYQTYHKGLSPAGMVLEALINEYYTDTMEPEAGYSLGYQYVTLSYGEMDEDEQGYGSAYFLSYFAQYALGYAYQDEEAITLWEVAKRGADFGSNLHTFIQPLVSDGMTEEEAQAAMDAADVKGKMEELLGAIQGGGVTFTLEIEEVGALGWGPYPVGED